VPEKPLTIEQILTLLRDSPPRIAALTGGLTPAQLHAAPGQGEWSANDVLAHLRSCADVWGRYITRILAEDRPAIRAVSPRTYVFGFDYVWEVYKPEPQRTFGYYVLPVLWGDRLVARFDSKLDRATNTLVHLGFWPEDEDLGQDEAFAEALARGLARFVRFLGASRLNAEAIREPLLRRRVGA
jgi:hypothetical protein